MKPMIFLFKCKIFLNRLRRELIVSFDMDYFDRQIAKRKGKCHYKICNAKCCGDCKYLNHNNNMLDFYGCSVYNNRPYFCQAHFPVDDFELKWFHLEKDCGFYWEDDKRR